MKAYSSYTAYLARLVSQTNSWARYEKGEKLISSALDGQASRALEALIDLPTRRKFGIFFTPSRYAKKVVSPLVRTLRNGPTVLDPSCGAGDLLIECSRFLPTKPTLSKTLELWGSLIIGFDIHSELITAAKYRLALSAIARGVSIDCEITNPNNIFPRLLASDALENTRAFEDADVVVTNPPYVKTNVDQHACDWASGSMSVASLFVDKLVSHCKTNTRIHAILPDVLRTGTLYRRWRSMIDDHLADKTIIPLGKFDKLVDVDVFLLHGTLTRTHFDDESMGLWPNDSYDLTSRSNNIRKFFDVSVGPLVPHRHKNRGNWHPYLHAKLCPPWGAVGAEQLSAKVRFHGTVFKPPFVVIRRTSSPKDKRRVVATLVKGRASVAIENHLIVLTPKSKNLADCRRLLTALNTEQLNKFINERNRCRHLTVGVIETIPFRL